jgi:hypothetical protein
VAQRRIRRIDAKEGERVATIALTNGRAAIRVDGLDRLYALRSRIEVYLDRVRGARVDPVLARRFAVLTSREASPPRLLMGTFVAVGDTIFCDVRDPAGAVVIDLADEHFRSLIVGVDAPDVAAAAINQAAAAKRR